MLRALQLGVDLGISVAVLLKTPALRLVGQACVESALSRRNILHKVAPNNQFAIEIQNTFAEFGILSVLQLQQSKGSLMLPVVDQGLSVYLSYQDRFLRRCTRLKQEYPVNCRYLMLQASEGLVQLK